MMKSAFVWMLAFLAGNGDIYAQVPVGNWRDHLPYHQATKLIAGSNKIICATPYSLFTVGLQDQSIERLSKTNGLHEVGISAIALTEKSDQLIVAYDNSNIDFIAANKIVNIDAIKRKDIAANKSILEMLSYQGYTYLSTGLGIIVLDENKYEVKDTWIIGNSGSYVPVSSFATDGSFFYAATAEGLKKASLANANLADYRNWSVIDAAAGFPAGACNEVVALQQRIIARKNDTLYQANGNQWTKFYTSDWNMVNTAASSGKILTIEQKGSEYRVVVLSSNGTMDRSVSLPSGSLPRQAVLVNNNVWIADLDRGLVETGAAGQRVYQLNSPAAITTGDLFVSNQSLWVASGSVTTGWQNTFTTNGLYRFENNEWNNYQPSKYPALALLEDLVSITADPVDKTVWAGSFGGGLLQLSADGTTKTWKGNAAIEPSLSDPGRYNVSGLAIDAQRNLWVSNYGAGHALAVRKADGTWRQFTVPYSLLDNAVSSIVVDEHDQKWIVSPNGNGLLCFNHGGSIDNTGDDRWKFYRAGTGNGNLPDNNVLSIARDKNGFIWVGTASGIGIIQCPGDIFSNSGCEAVIPIVQQDNFAGYLFKGEAVQTICVDGADRKWIGTKNGTWLISADGDKTISRFTADNSFLLDNDVKKIAIDPVTGEVFFATAKGICSFRGTATEATDAASTVLAFPNPVPPGYTGTIAIRGLAGNAFVKITELNGRLVFQTRANGGQVTWNGKDYTGRAVSSGVYLVIAATDRGGEKLVTKIVVVK